MVIKGILEIEFIKFKGEKIEKTMQTRKAVAHWLKKLTQHTKEILKKEKNLDFKLIHKVE